MTEIKYKLCMEWIIVECKILSVMQLYNLIFRLSKYQVMINLILTLYRINYSMADIDLSEISKRDRRTNVGQDLPS